MNHLSLFSGIGGLDLAAEMAGFKTVGQCEWANPQTDADFRAITPPGFARAFYEANKAETWNTRAPVLSAEEMEMLEGME